MSVSVACGMRLISCKEAVSGHANDHSTLAPRLLAGTGRDDTTGRHVSYAISLARKRELLLPALRTLLSVQTRAVCSYSRGSYEVRRPFIAGRLLSLGGTRTLAFRGPPRHRGGHRLPLRQPTDLPRGVKSWDSTSGAIPETKVNR